MKVVAINSMPAHGNAGLKMVMHILGTKVIPVPSLLLTGIGSIQGIQKFPIPFESMLRGTLDLTKQLNENIILYVGYLGDANQIGIIKQCIDDYKEVINSVIVDPVCGDHGRAYVPQEIIANWGELITAANFCLPNITEVALLTNQIDNFNQDKTDSYIAKFIEYFPKTTLIVTSLEEDNELVNKLIYNANTYESRHHKLLKNYGGSGDAFAAYFIDFHFYQNMPLNTAIYKAGEAVKDAIAYSIKNEEPFLMLG